MKKKFLSLLCGAFCCFTMMAQTSNSSSELRLSLAEARDYAIEHNRTLQNADLTVRPLEQYSLYIVRFVHTTQRYAFPGDLPNKLMKYEGTPPRAAYQTLSVFP